MAQHFLLLYDTVPNYLEKRVPYRDEHLSLVQHYHKTGIIALAGAFDPADGAAFIFKTEDRKAVEDFVLQDPYVNNGLITNWSIKKWTVAVGG